LIEAKSIPGIDPWPAFAIAKAFFLPMKEYGKYKIYTIVEEYSYILLCTGIYYIH
jgi:hypothetical protein